MPTPRLRTAAILLGLGLVVTPALSGCIPSVDDLVGGLVQEGIQSGLKEATGLDYEVGSLPKDFPADVPLPEGEILGGVGVDTQEGAKGWAVQLATDRSLEQIQAQLEAAGFAALDSGGLAMPGMFMHENDQYMITGLVAEGEADGGKNAVNYTVILKSE
ncbi:MAG TPA: hypothetical protein VNQ48_00525 [Microbacteriaceae bacterium]|nr:hypothetical protein [Microbacteriaceae bacterium]